MGLPLVPHKRKIQDEKTSFGSINIGSIVGSFKYSKLGCEEHPMWCTHSHWKGWGFANLYPHHLMHICKEGEDDL